MRFQLRLLNYASKGCAVSDEINPVHRNGHGIPWPNCPPLDALSALIFRANRTLPLEQLVASLPDSIDRQVATGWFVAAIEEDASDRYNRKST